jgi:hypothetical protein
MPAKLFLIPGRICGTSLTLKTSRPYMLGLGGRFYTFIGKKDANHIYEHHLKEAKASKVTQSKIKGFFVAANAKFSPTKKSRKSKT